jgi:hypothetical protein
MSLCIDDRLVCRCAPVAHVFEIKESDDSMKQLLQYIKDHILVQVKHLCRPEIHCTFTLTAARLHKMSLFPV